MKWDVVAVCVALFVAVGSSEVRAASGDGSSGASSPSQYATFTVSTLNLAKPVLSSDGIDYGPEFQVMGEANIIDIFGVAGSFTYNRATGTAEGESFGMNLYRVGAQGVWYPIGHFGTGMQVGVQGMHSWTSVDTDIAGLDVEAFANQTSVAAIVGYKKTISPGFAILGQVGGGPIFRRFEGEASGGGGKVTEEKSEIAPKIVLNFNLGWTF